MSDFPFRKAFNAVTVSAFVCAGWSLPAFPAPFDFDDFIEEENAPNSLYNPLPIPSPKPELKTILVGAVKALQTGDFISAEFLAREITKQVPEAPEGWHLLGVALANLNESDAALDALGRAASLYTKNAEPFVIMGDLLEQKGRREEAISAFRSAAQRDPNNWRAQEGLALLLEADGFTDAAIQHYKQAVELAPQDRFLLRLRLARLFVLADRFEEAEAVLVSFTSNNPDNFRALAGLGQVQMASNKPKDAADTYRRAIELAPEYEKLAYRLALAERMAGRFEDAEITLLRARAQFSNSAESIYELATHYGAIRDYERALATFSEGLAIHPGDPGLLKGASIAHFRLGDPGAALPYAEKLAAREDHNASDLQWLAILQEKNGLSDNAAATYEKVVALDETAWIAANNLAALISESDPARAVEFATMAAEQVPDQTDVQDTLGWALFNSGDLDAALEIYDRITSGDRAKATYLYHQGRVMIAQGDDTGGKEKLRAALEMDPTFAYSEDAKARLSN